MLLMGDMKVEKGFRPKRDRGEEEEGGGKGRRGGGIFNNLGEGRD
jgi:hypothetical protein